MPTLFTNFFPFYSTMVELTLAGLLVDPSLLLPMIMMLQLMSMVYLPHHLPFHSISADNFELRSNMHGCSCLTNTCICCCEEYKEL